MNIRRTKNAISLQNSLIQWLYVHAERRHSIYDCVDWSHVDYALSDEKMAEIENFFSEYEECAVILPTESYSERIYARYDNEKKSLRFTLTWGEKLSFRKREYVTYYEIADTTELTFSIYSDGRIFAVKNTRTMPVVSTMLFSIQKKTSKVIHDFIGELFEQFKNLSYVFRDLFREYETYGIILPNIAFNDLYNCKTIEDYYIKKYKKLKRADFSINKHGFNMTYILMSCKPHVTDKTYASLKKCKNMNELFDDVGTVYFHFEGIDDYQEGDYEVFRFKELASLKSKYPKDVATAVFFNYYMNKYGYIPYITGKKIEHLDARDMFRDMLKMENELNIKHDFRFKTYKGAERWHDELARRVRLKSAGKLTDLPIVKPSEDGVYRKLIENLPEEFERINTNKRLFQEAEIQNNCVFSYLEDIRERDCEIYSYISPTTDTRYTIEFRYGIKKKKPCYYVMQMYKASNEKGPKEDYTTVNKILDEINSTNGTVVLNDTDDTDDAMSEDYF